MKRPDATRPGRFPLGIRGRLTLWFILGAVGTMVVGAAVFYVSGMTAIQATLGKTYCQIAARVVGQYEDRFAGQAADVGRIATDVLTTGVVMEQNLIYRKRPAAWIAARVRRQAAEWRAAPEAHRRKAALHRQLSHRLSVLAGLEAGLVRRLAVYDGHGVAVAASDPPAERHARGRRWFKAATGGKRHFTYVDVDKAAGVLSVVVPVWGGVDIAGYVVAEFDQAAMSRQVRDIRFGESGLARLVDYAGVPLAGKARPFLIQALARQPAPRRGGAEPYWVSLPRDGGWPFWQRLACVAPTGAINRLRQGFELPPWAVVVTQAPGESYAALQRSLGWFAVAGVIGVLVIGLGGGFIAWHIAAPLKDLQDGVRRFARGERDRPVEVSGAAEIGELAEEFNRMAERVTASEIDLRAFAQAVADATDAIFMADPEGVIYYVNPAFEAVTGYARAEVEGATPSLLESPRTPAQTYPDMWRAIEAGEPWRGALWNRRKDGTDYPIDLTISPIRDATGVVVARLGIHRDMTLARRYEESLEREVAARSREIAETQGLKVMGEMASMIAHDLRNALSTVKMNLQILFRRHRDAGEAEFEHCQMGLEQVAYMEDILRDMLSYARPERLRADWHDVNPIVDEALAAVAHLTARHGIAVRRDDTKGLPKVYCDRVKALQVVRNLVDNAILAMPEGGDMTVTTRLLMEASAPMVQVSVRDTGPGISEELHGQVFEPFFTTRSRGTGLGLAIARRIVEQHGGRITIDPCQGPGARLTISLPTVPADP